MGEDIVRDDVISFECVVKLTYKNCEVTIRQFGQIVEMRIINFSNKGYLIEKTDTFLYEIQYSNLLNFLNKHNQRIERLCLEMIEENTRNDNKIMQF